MDDLMLLKCGFHALSLSWCILNTHCTPSLPIWHSAIAACTSTLLRCRWIPVGERSRSLSLVYSGEHVCPHQSCFQQFLILNSN